MNGLLIVDKPAGLTSHDVVGAVRRAAQLRKVGHAGTLDPLATGVLVLALGKATRTLEFLTAHDKLYEATVRLGVTTDSYDAEGTVLTTHAGPLPEHAAVLAALAHFQGALAQRPPAFSAIKQGGEPLYRKARRGEIVELEPRPVALHEATLLHLEPPLLRLRLHVSKGFYVRSLAHDLGERLGVGGHLAALRRCASGPFTVAQAQPLAAVQGATPERLAGWLLPLGAGLEALPARSVSAEELALLQQGKALPGPQADGPVRALDAQGQLAAILHWRADRGWQPIKVFL